MSNKKNHIEQFVDCLLIRILLEIVWLQITGFQATKENFDLQQRPIELTVHSESKVAKKLSPSFLREICV